MNATVEITDREDLLALIRSERELNEEKLKRIEDQIQHAKELSASQREGDQLALTTALTASKEMLQAHNGLLRKIEKLAETFATKEELEKVLSWQAKATGGGVVIATVGLANFVKIWTN
jgi:hypothetical protein